MQGLIIYLFFQVSLPSKKLPTQRGSYMFYALEPKSQYEVVIQSQNQWGWSENSDPFFFSTRANGKKRLINVSIAGQIIWSEYVILPMLKFATI